MLKLPCTYPFVLRRGQWALHGVQVSPSCSPREPGEEDGCSAEGMQPWRGMCWRAPRPCLLVSTSFGRSCIDASIALRKLLLPRYIAHGL